MLVLCVACAGAQRGQPAERDAGVDAARVPDLGVDLGPPDLGVDAGPPPLAMPEPSVDLALAGESSCALLGGVVRCWGSNRFGQLGDPALAVGNRTRRAQPTPVAGLQAPLRIVAGAFHVCALEATGTVRCWGHGGWGQLGDGAREDRSAPVAVTGLTDAVGLAAGTGHTCALRATGQVVCWGRNHMGQLGDGTTELHTEPTPVEGIERAVQVVAGVAHSCALLPDGTARCWGENLEGQLGDGSRSAPAGYRASAEPVQGLQDATALASGAAHVCALAGGEVLCWGRNDSFQLGAQGRGSANEVVPEPVAMVEVSGAMQLALGARYSCVLVRAVAEAADPAIRCVGLDHRGQLGNGTRRLQRTATPTEPLPGPVVRLAAGVQHTCAITEDRAVWCWGDDRRDQIGHGRHRLVAEPHQVIAPAEPTATTDAD